MPGAPAVPRGPPGRAHSGRPAGAEPAEFSRRAGGGLMRAKRAKRIAVHAWEARRDQQRRVDEKGGDSREACDGLTFAEFDRREEVLAARASRFRGPR